MTGSLSEASIDAISAVGGGVSLDKDIVPALRAVGLELIRASGGGMPGAVYVHGTNSHVHRSLSSLNVDDPDVVSRILRFAARISEVYAASPKADPARMVRLRNALADDGFSLDAAGDPVASITALATTAGAALSDAAAVCGELARLERAIPQDPVAAIGRAKNLIEATAKAVLHLRGLPINDNSKVPALVHQVSEALGILPKQVPPGPHREQFLRILEQLKAVTQGLAELRNDVGDGHGAVSVPSDVTPAHGRLAARAAIAWSAFVLDIAMAP